MALDSFVKTNLHGTISLADGTGTPLTMTLTFDRGDFSVGPLKDVLNETVKFDRRGKFLSAAPGARIYPSGSFSAYVHQFTDATADVLSDFLLRNGKYAAAVSTLGTSHPVYAVDITMTLEGTDFGGVDSTFTLHDCVVVLDTFSEGEPDTFAISFEVLGQITGDLACAEIV